MNRNLASETPISHIAQLTQHLILNARETYEEPASQLESRARTCLHPSHQSRSADLSTASAAEPTPTLDSPINNT